MAYHISDTGVVTDWQNNTSLVTGGSLAPSFSINLECDEHDITAMSGNVTSVQNLAGLFHGTATIDVRLNPAKIGSTGLVTHSAGYAASAKMWTMDIEAPAQETTAFNASGVTSKAFQPSLIRWGGTYESFIDTSVTMVQPGGTTASATFKILEHTLGTDHTLAGNIFVSRYQITQRIGDLAVVSATYKGDGNLAAAGTSGTGIGAPWFTNGSNVAIPTAGTLTLTGSSGKTYAGSAFWERFSIRCGVGEVVTASITARFSGGVTIS